MFTSPGSPPQQGYGRPEEHGKDSKFARRNVGLVAPGRVSRGDPDSDEPSLMASPLLSDFAQCDVGRWCSHLAACPAQARCCRPHLDVPCLCVPTFNVSSRAQPSPVSVGLCKTHEKTGKVISFDGVEGEKGQKGRCHVGLSCSLEGNKSSLRSRESSREAAEG